MQYARRERITAADPVHDPGDHHFGCLDRAVARVDARGEAVDVHRIDLARGRGDQLQFEKCNERRRGGFAAAVLAVPGKVGAAEQQRDVAVIAEHQVGLDDDLGQDRAGIAVPPLPQLAAPVAVERYRDAARRRGAGGRHRRLRRHRAERRRDPREMQPVDALQQPLPVPSVGRSLGEGRPGAVVQHFGRAHPGRLVTKYSASRSPR